MFNLLSSEIFRLRKRSQSWILFVIASALIAFIYAGVVIGAVTVTGPDAVELSELVTFANFQDFGIGMSLGFFGAVMLIIIAAGMMGNEFAWNTLRPLVARARSRSGLLTAKYLALLLYSVVFAIATTLAVAGVIMISSQIVDEPSGFSMSVLGEGFVFSFQVLYALLPYLALALLLATAFRSNAAGIAGSLGLNFIEEPIWLLLSFASSIFENVREWGLAYSVTRFATVDGADMRSALILAGYTALFVGISYVIFLRRDVTSG